MPDIDLLRLLAGLALALTFGGMTFFSALMAPLIFTQLPLETAAPFIRRVFPWYYLVMGATSLVAALALLIQGHHSALAILLALVVLGFTLARQVLMPRINQARDLEAQGDREAGARFARLHRLSVVINALQWLAVVFALGALLA